MNIDKIYIDGASRGNPGRASYAVIIYTKEGKILRRGEVFEHRTNNQMEILAGAKALFFITKARESGEIPADYQVVIHTDSALLSNMFNKGWIYRWEVKKTIDDHANNDLIWNILLQSYKAGPFKFKWVKGHNGDKGNEEADRYCNQLLDNYGK